MPLIFQPADCKALIERLKSCSDLHAELQQHKTWNHGKVGNKSILCVSFCALVCALESRFRSRIHLQRTQPKLVLKRQFTSTQCKEHLD